MDEHQIDRLTEEAIQALESGDCLRALAIADQLAAVVPDDPAVRAIRAEALVKTDAGEEALSEARRAAELNPESDRTHTLLGLAAWRAGKLSLAQQSLERAIELSGRKPRVLADYAWFMASERGPRPAEQAAKQAVAANPKSSTAWAALGLAQFRLRHRRAADASLRHALELDPNDPYAQSVMVALLHEQRKDSSAVALASLLEETPGTEQIVDEIRRQADKRQLEKTLIERGAVRPPTHDESSPLSWAAAGLVFLLACGLGALALLLPKYALWIALGGFLLLALLCFFLRLIS